MTGTHGHFMPAISMSVDLSATIISFIWWGVAEQNQNSEKYGGNTSETPRKKEKGLLSNMHFVLWIDLNNILCLLC